MKEVDNKDSFGYWLDEAKKGDECIYYEGFLLRDKELYLRENPHSYAFPVRINCAIAAYAAMENNRVLLYQRRKDDLHYEYYAKKI